ncbi:chorismate-binding protein [Pulveribacter suum]|uniref:Bifunctional aminodeoxychorismate synthase component I/aminotransferase n=1 Tax=Pulveribacter suum TaxID=2116657 RepID=A0A2P1NJ71_9BURK|nr:chorismate-binding protein [Pulveribacter suum]AVP57071.1 bifunctional aminodeoxychorismate synthase component I/aminotransferase [Pulveribacter suum]
MHEATALIDFSDPRDDAAPRLRHAFGAPLRVLQARRLDEVPAVLHAVEQAARAGLWCVGGLRYEAAPAFDAALAVHGQPDGGAAPLAWFAIHAAPLPWPQAAAGAPQDARINWDAPLPRADFDAALARIQQGIAEGRFYQVNYTAPLAGRLSGAPQALFAALQRAQPGGYATCIDMGVVQALSVSPELFFDWRADAQGCGAILTRPMKGTAARGASAADDAAQQRQLRDSPKERAENVMIVDLLRNDLSRIAQPGSVQVPRLLHTQALPTVWQMTSDVRATTRTGTGLADVFAALFPCGSVTGAPKVEAMRAIRALEAGPRGLYCGALGVVRPDPEGGAGAIAATFNVPIRTLERQGSELRCGIGSGIVWGAQAQAEWREWAAKRAFLERASEPFELLQTLALEEGRLRHQALHLARLQRAAAHFGYPFDAQAVAGCLDRLICQHASGAWRVRLLLDAHGRPRAEAVALAATASPVLLALAERPFAAAHSEFTRHKTTRRGHYAAFAPQPGSGVFDTLLYNEAGEITETTFGNIAARLDGRWVTPPVACGLLPGVGREVLLREGRLHEAVLTLQDLPRVQGWAFVNSLRGWLAAEVQAPGVHPQARPLLI